MIQRMTRATMIGLREEFRKAVRKVSMELLRLNNFTVQMGISAVSVLRVLNGRGTRIDEIRGNNAFRHGYIRSHWIHLAGKGTSAQLIM